MPINLDAVGLSSGVVRRSWTSKDALLYAVAVGANAGDPLDRELVYTTENTAGIDQQVLPTFAVVAAQSVANFGAQYGEFDRAKLVHAEQSVTLSGALPVDGEIDAEARIVGIWDKGSGAVIETTTTMHDAASQQLVAELGSKIFIRGEGGWGGDRGPASPPKCPEREPDHVVNYRTLLEQALIYRLTGDRNPLHSDPAFAARGGFDRPILHGMCTYGFTGRALLRTMCDLDSSRFTAMSARFTKPVMPGDELSVHIWRVSEGLASFQTWRGSDVVIDGGVLKYVE